MSDLATELRSTEHPVATTRVLQGAVDRLAERGGGRVTVPPGEWTIATLFLRHGISLHLERGAVLKLYDLAEDLGERRDIAADRPETVREMAALFVEARTESEAFPLFEDRPRGAGKRKKK